MPPLKAEASARSSQMIIAASGLRSAPGIAGGRQSRRKAIRLRSSVPTRSKKSPGIFDQAKAWEPKWEPTCTDTERRQATSSQHQCRLPLRRAASGHVQRPDGADLGAGGRGFESLHPDRSQQLLESICHIFCLRDRRTHDARCRPTSPGGLAGSSGSDIWAAGGDFIEAGDPAPVQPFVFRWTGSAFRRVKLRLRPADSLRSLTVDSPRNVWLAGPASRYQQKTGSCITHWNGRRWSAFLPRYVGAASWSPIVTAARGSARTRTGPARN